MHAVVILGKITPHHIARLEAAGKEGEVHGHRLSVVEVADSQNDYYWPENAMPMKHVNHFCLFPQCDYWTLSYRRIKIALHEILSRLAPDVIVVNGWGFKDALAGLGWSIRNDVPCVVISENHELKQSRLALRLWLKRLLVTQFQACFVSGTPQIRYLSSMGLPEGRCFVGYSVVDNAWFANRIEQVNRTTARQRPSSILLTSARLIPAKNLLFVLDVLANQATEWTWLIAGYGPLREEINHHIRQLGLVERVRLLGAVDYYQLPEVYAQADAYLQPSLWEPWGLVVNEAMACGLPVVASQNCGCQEDLVRNNINGFIFDPNSSDSLADALTKLTASRARWTEMGQASRQMITKWGLNLCAQNFWRAGETALLNPSKSLQSHIAGTILGRML
jgi:glycosyltransferase involved in cell wall biosynthesis